MATATKEKKPKVKKEKKAKPPEVKSDVPPGLDHEALAEIASAEQWLTKCEKDHKDAGAAKKIAKEKEDGARLNLREKIQDAVRGQKSLFSGVPATPSSNGDGHAAEDETWRSMKLASLAISKGVLANLAEANVVTVGDYADYMKPKDSGFTPQLTDIKGIGEGAVTKIESAIDDFLTEHRKKADEQRQAAAKVVADVAASTEIPAHEQAKPGTPQGGSDQNSHAERPKRTDPVG